MKWTKADREWAAKVKERDGYRCRRCLRYFPEGNRRGLDAHHIFSKGGHPATRFEILNGVSLCTGHHIAWAHRDPLEFHEWAKDQLSVSVYDALRKRSVKV